MVVTVGGPLLPGQSDIHPVPSVPLLVTGMTAGGVHLVRHLATGIHGRFALKLPPGTYTVTADIYTQIRQASSPTPKSPSYVGNPFTFASPNK